MRPQCPSANCGLETIFKLKNDNGAPEGWKMRLDDSPAARLQQDCTTAVNYKTVVRWQMGLFSVWHSGRIISQILVPLDAKCERVFPVSDILTVSIWSYWSWHDTMHNCLTRPLYDPATPSCDGIKIPRTAAVPLHCWQQQIYLISEALKSPLTIRVCPCWATTDDSDWSTGPQVHILCCLL